MSAIEILDRLHKACGTKNHFQLCKYLSFSTSVVDGWIRRNSNPYEACFRCYQKTGYSIHWLLTGEGPERFDTPDKIEVPNDEEIDRFRTAKTLPEHMAISLEDIQDCIHNGIRESARFGIMQFAQVSDEVGQALISNRIISEWQQKYAEKNEQEPQKE